MTALACLAAFAVGGILATGLAIVAGRVIAAGSAHLPGEGDGP